MIGTKPSVVKYAVRGTAILEGKTEEIEKMLDINPKTKVPHVLSIVYQHVFTSTYLLSTILNTPYPPPDLLHTEEEKLGLPPEEEAILQPNVQTSAEEHTEKTAEKNVEETKPAEAAPVREET